MFGLADSGSRRAALNVMLVFDPLKEGLLGSAEVAAGLSNTFTRLFLEYTVLLEPFFFSIPARRTLGSADSRGLRPLPPTPEPPLA